MNKFLRPPQEPGPTSTDGIQEILLAAAKGIEANGDPEKAAAIRESARIFDGEMRYSRDPVVVYRTSDYPSRTFI